jgi:tellurite resistance protein TehA-like permease
MTTVLRTRPTTRSGPAPVGPAWYGAVMGTGILATVTQTLVPDVWVARGLLVIGWLLLLGLTFGFVARTVRCPAVFTASLRVAHLPLWGMVSMGLLSVGSATATVLPPWLPAFAWPAVLVDEVLWTLGTIVGLATAIGFTALLIRSDAGAPTTVWGLAVVPPMVSATVGAGLAPHLGSTALQVGMLVIALACFILSLALGAVIFAVAYHHHWRVAGLAIGASTTAWIPLGVVGQSTAAAQVMAGQAAALLPASLAGTAQDLANDYGVVMLSLGVPLAGWAVAMNIRGFRHRMPFVPGWWSLTFPIGTLALGGHLLGVGTGMTVFLAAGTVCWLTLGGTWTLCAVASARAVAGRVRTSLTAG